MLSRLNTSTGSRPTSSRNRSSTCTRRGLLPLWQRTGEIPGRSTGDPGRVPLSLRATAKGGERGTQLASLRQVFLVLQRSHPRDKRSHLPGSMCSRPESHRPADTPQRPQSLLPKFLPNHFPLKNCAPFPHISKNSDIFLPYHFSHLLPFRHPLPAAFPP